MFAGLQRSVLRPQVVDYAFQEFERQSSASLANLSSTLDAMRRRRAAVQEELNRLVAAIASVRHSPALVKAINEREQELAAITQRLLASQSDAVPAQLSLIRQFVSERLGNIRQLLYSDLPKAKAEPAKQSQQLRCSPHGG